MKHFYLILMLTFFSHLFGSAATAKLQHVHPLNWWAGMNNPVVQVLLHGEGIGDCDVTLTEAQNVGLVRIERTENKNYLFIYLDTRYAPAQTFGIALWKDKAVDGKHKGKPYLTHPYELKRRDNLEERKTWSYNQGDVLYLLMPDRFINANPSLNTVKGMVEPTVNRNHEMDFGRHGGDLAGIRKGIPYLADLGVTAIWPTPVQENEQSMSYHGYAITDYYHIDPRMGTNEEYRALVEEMHKNGLKMVMDLVFNHCGSNNFLCKDLPDSTWFNNNSKFTQSAHKTMSAGDPHASAYDRKATLDGWFVRTMPDWNQRNPLVRDYLIQASIWWIEYAKIDGIRQDTYPYADPEMMRDWNLAVRNEYPYFNIVGETWMANPAAVAWWQKDSPLHRKGDIIENTELPSVMDFPLMTILNQQADEETTDWGGGLYRIYEYLCGDMQYANTNNLLTFLDNHDTDRFHKTAEQAQNVDRYTQTLTLLLTLRGTPQLYYGNELGMYATKSKGDGWLRQDFPEEAISDVKSVRKVENSEVSGCIGGEKSAELHAVTRTLLNWRKGCKAITEGQKLTHFAPQNGCYVYSRGTRDNNNVVVMLNGTSEKQTIELERYAEVFSKDTDKVPVDVLTGKPVKLGKTMTLKPRQTLVLQF